MKVLLIAYDNDSYIHWFPIGLAYIASALRDAGHDVEIYNQDAYHWPEEHLTNYLNKNRYDVIGIGVVAGYYQFRKLVNISQAIDAAENKPFYIIGGHGPSPEPGYFLKKTKANAVVLGEGEVTVVNLLNALSSGTDISEVNGIAYLEGKTVRVTEPQPLIKNLNSIAYPAWDLFPIDYYSLLRKPHIHNNERTFPVLSSRGCPFRCNFCYRMDKGIRLRSEENIIQEIRNLKNRYHISYIIFADELFMVSPGRAKSLSRAFIDANLNINWWCNGRLNYATSDVLELMKQAGCVHINYGIECMDNKILTIMNKKLSVEQITRGIEATLKVGISPGINIIFGNIGENADTLKKGVDLLLKYDHCDELRTIRPVTPYPGSPLYYYAIEKGLLKDVEDFYENKHVNSDLLTVNFTELSDNEFYKQLNKANETLLENYFKHQLKKYKKKTCDLYFKQDVSFRGFRQT